MIRATIILFVGLLIMPGPVIAQNESGNRYLNEGRYHQKSKWIDSSKIKYQQCFPIIRSFPPVSAGMPDYVLESYMYIDSLLKSPDMKFRTLMWHWPCFEDTMKTLLKHLYIVNDYSPVVFNQYVNEVDYYKYRKDRKKMAMYTIDKYGNKTVVDNKEKRDTTDYSGPYHNSLKTLCYSFNKLREIKEYSDQMAYFAVLYSDYILRVKIVSVDSYIDKGASINDRTYNYRAVVLDILKGQTLPANTVRLPDEDDESNPPAFSFQSSPYTFMNSKWGHFEYNAATEDFRPYRPDTAFGERFIMKHGQEAIVFVKMNNPKIDYECDWFDLQLEPECSLGALRIENGIVYDINNIWSSQDALDYEDWKQIFLKYKNNILTEKY